MKVPKNQDWSSISKSDSEKDVNRSGKKEVTQGWQMTVNRRGGWYIQRWRQKWH